MSGDITYTEPAPPVEYVAAAPRIGLTPPDEDLTERFVAAGHVVERAPRSQDTVTLRLTPEHRDVYSSLGWAAPGPTAPRRQVRIRWDDPEAREATIAPAPPSRRGS